MYKKIGYINGDFSNFSDYKYRLCILCDDLDLIPFYDCKNKIYEKQIDVMIIGDRDMIKAYGLTGGTLIDYINRKYYR